MPNQTKEEGVTFTNYLKACCMEHLALYAQGNEAFVASHAHNLLNWVDYICNKISGTGIDLEKDMESQAKAESIFGEVRYTYFTRCENENEYGVSSSKPIREIIDELLLANFGIKKDTQRVQN